jgi:hypothetical protein
MGCLVDVQLHRPSSTKTIDFEFMNKFVDGEATWDEMTCSPYTEDDSLTSMKQSDESNKSEHHRSTSLNLKPGEIILFNCGHSIKYEENPTSSSSTLSPPPPTPATH